MKKWWAVVAVVILFIAGLVWKVVAMINCTDEGGIAVAPLTGHQNCAER
jgi:hypothetical protein